MIQELVNTLTRASQSVPEFSATASELEPGWFPTDDLTDLKSGRLADALARLAADYPGADTRTQAALFINQYAWYLSGAATIAFLLEKRVPDLTQPNIALRYNTMMLALNVAILLTVTLFYKELLAIAFDETFAQTRSLPVLALYLGLLLLIALTVVMMMRVVGLIMVIALLTIPAAISGMFVYELRRMMALAVVLAMTFTFTGLWLSYFYNLTSGATIIMVAGTAYVLSLGLRSLLRLRGRHQHAVT